MSENPSVDLARLGFGENFQVSPCFTPNLVVKYCKNHGYPVDFA